MNLLARFFRPFGVDIFCFGRKFLVFNLVSRNLKVKYRRSVFGIFWTLLAPLSTALVYYFVFKVILKIDKANYMVMILSGIMPWTFFSQTVSESMTNLVDQQSLITKISIPIQIFPFVNNITNFINLLLSLPIVIVLYFWSGLSFGPQLFMVAYFYGCLFLISYGLSIVAAFAYVFFRDLRHLLGIFLQLCFYATPILYHEDMIPEKYYWIVYANPIGSVMVGIHNIFLDSRMPPPSITFACAIWAVVFYFLGALWLNGFKKTVVENL